MLEIDCIILKRRYRTKAAHKLELTGLTKAIYVIDMKIILNRLS